jgi:hypothetical protein
MLHSSTQHVTAVKPHHHMSSLSQHAPLRAAAHACVHSTLDPLPPAPPPQVDPRKVPEAVCLSSLTYHEAWELSYFGANVLHPRTTLPAMKYHIPITIRNFFNLAAPGGSTSTAAQSTAAAGRPHLRSAAATPQAANAA